MCIGGRAVAVVNSERSDTEHRLYQGQLVRLLDMKEYSRVQGKLRAQKAGNILLNFFHFFPAVIGSPMKTNELKWYNTD